MASLALSPDIEFYRDRGYACLGTDGECYYFLQNGLAYFFHEDLGFRRMDGFTETGLVSNPGPHREREHGTVQDMLFNHLSTQYYADLAEYLFPNQLRAWTLPLNQEC